MSGENSQTNGEREAAPRLRKLELEIDAAQTEGDLRHRKLAAEAVVAEREIEPRLQKLDADLRISERFASSAAWRLEWLKAAAVPIAFLGIFLTSVFSALQLGAAYENAEAAAIQAQTAKSHFEAQMGITSRQAAIADSERRRDRLEGALARLSRDSVSDRILAISSIRRLLGESHRETDAAALMALVDRLAVEEEWLVRSLIKEVFDDATLIKLDLAARSQALATVAERSRAFLLEATRNTERNDLAALKGALEKFPSRNRRADSDLADLMEEASKLPFLTLVEITARAFPVRKIGNADTAGPRSPSDILSTEVHPKVSEQLVDMSLLIEALVATGAQAKDLRRIYCAGCKFSRAPGRAMNGVLFDGAVLDGADFSDMNLQNASFQGTSIWRARFNRSDLGHSSFSEALVRRGGPSFYWNEDNPLPQFICANLSDANLVGVPLALVVVKYEPSSIVTQVSASNLKGTTTSQGTIIAAPLVAFETAAGPIRDPIRSGEAASPMSPPTADELDELILHFAPPASPNSGFSGFTVEDWIRVQPKIGDPAFQGFTGPVFALSSSDLRHNERLYLTHGVARYGREQLNKASAVVKKLMLSSLEQAGLDGSSPYQTLRRVDAIVQQASAQGEECFKETFVPYVTAASSQALRMPWYAEDKSFWDPWLSRPQSTPRGR